MRRNGFVSARQGGLNPRPRLRFVPNRSASRWEVKRLITSLGSDTVFSRWYPAEIRTTNARVETVQPPASYRGPWSRGQRCLVVASGFYEWQVLADGKTKIPLYIQVNDQETFAFAGLWDLSETDTGAHRNLGKTVWLATFTTPSAACRLALRTPTGKLG
jgi:putative SOS response-associated peptidase YedK